MKCSACQSISHWHKEFPHKTDDANRNQVKLNLFSKKSWQLLYQYFVGNF